MLVDFRTFSEITRGDEAVTGICVYSLLEERGSKGYLFSLITRGFDDIKGICVHLSPVGVMK